VGVGVVVVALLLRNVWVWLHYAVLSTPRRGSRRLNPGRLSLKEVDIKYRCKSTA
jgi:hypothetical protein